MKRVSRLVFPAFVMAVAATAIVFADRYDTPEQQQQAEAKNDKLNILRKADMQTDTSKQFVTVPADYPGVKDFDVAKEAPTIDFAVVQGLDPFYLPTQYDGDKAKGGVYGGWGDVTLGPDDCFYFSIGNHMAFGGTAYIIKYNPSTKTQSIVVDLKKTVGYGDDVFGDGKFHGDPDIGPGGEMWLLSYFGPPPSKEDMATTYRGSWLIRYNVFTGETESLGIPLEGASWPYHAYDWERGLLFGVDSLKGYVIAYDTRERRMLYGAAPKLGITWYERGILLDRDTGIVYTTDTKIGQGEGLVDRYKGEQRFASYERRNNTFTIMKSSVPPNPVTGKITPMRSHTKIKDGGGAFWCTDVSGGMFRFFPSEDRVEAAGAVNWGKEGVYIANMSFSPKKRYLYYVVDAATHGALFGTPVVQFDTTTKRKKVIAFLNDFYLDKYGYSPGGTYGIEIDTKGETLFFYTNGQFTTKEKGSGYGRPAIFSVHIPESERKE